MTSTIIIRTDSTLKAKAQKTAAELGLTLSTVINNQLKRFVEEKSFFTTSKKNLSYEANSRKIISNPVDGPRPEYCAATVKNRGLT